MIDYIRGVLTYKEVTRVSVETNGVGFDINIPLSTYEKLGETGTETVLYIHNHIREDAHKLYGFISRQEREMFRHLISISKIGPKAGLSVLSGITIDELIRSINTSDPSRLEKIPGVGVKTAQRLVLELKGKLGKNSFTPKPAKTINSGDTVTDFRSSSVRDEAFAAMVSLGYNEKQVIRALSRVDQVIEKNAQVEDWIKNALQVI
ncbi:MAG TPA: Holliday junction branch migration protein RuvA [Chitinispirillaceae bacterium]|jgi:Holliday junction DNA helicase RuvA|nr:Holliday junction branch migration protein RuvA [Chitinispirillaceae bacterium]